MNRQQFIRMITERIESINYIINNYEHNFNEEDLETFFTRLTALENLVLDKVN